jgi:hypothetical protein
VADKKVVRLEVAAGLFRQMLAGFGAEWQHKAAVTSVFISSGFSGENQPKGRVRFQ